MSDFKGIYVASVTPFDSKGNVNYDMVDKLVEKFVNDGLEGIYITGSTGEFPLLDEDERINFTDAVCKAAKGKLKVICQIGSESFRRSIRLTEAAAKSGVDAISSVAPYYFEYSFPEVKKYYKTLANVSDAPMIMYNVPGYTGVSLTVENIQELAEDPKIIGMKHTSYDFMLIERVKALLPNFIVFSGPDEMCLSALSMGIDGAIGTTYNFQGTLYKKLYDSFKAGDFNTALKCQNRANAVIHEILDRGVIQSTKLFLKLQGYDCGVCREPMKELTDEDTSILTKVYEDFIAPAI